MIGRAAEAHRDEGKVRPCPGQEVASSYRWGCSVEHHPFLWALSSVIDTEPCRYLSTSHG